MEPFGILFIITTILYLRVRPFLFRTTQVEVAHEALIRNWHRLVEWLEDERVNLRQRLRLTATAQQWKEKGRDVSALLRGALLEDARKYDDLNELEIEFIKQSVAYEQQKLNEQNKLRNRITIGSAMAAFSCLVLANIAFLQWQDAKYNETKAQSAKNHAVTNEAKAIEKMQKAKETLEKFKEEQQKSEYLQTKLNKANREIRLVEPSKEQIAIEKKRMGSKHY